MKDLRDDILRSVMQKSVTASIISDANGMIAGTDGAQEGLKSLGVVIEYIVTEGASVKEGDVIVRFSGNPKQVVMAEEIVIGHMSKSSGIATAARDFVQESEGKFRVISGAWKKMPPSMKHAVRHAVSVGGASFRITPDPMIYLDKNYIEMLGGIKASLEAVKGIKDHKKVLQLKGRSGDVVREAWVAARAGADIIFVDTGCLDDVRQVVERMQSDTEKSCPSGRTNKPEIAFAGAIQLKDLAALKELDIDAVDVGRSIVDAPLLDMRMEVVVREEETPGYDLLDKKELKIESIKLDGANLTDVAATVADTLGIDRSDVLVIDVRGDVVDLDILKNNINPHAFAGKEKELLQRLAELPGVQITDKTAVSSRGILGWIAVDEGVDEEEIKLSLKRAEEMAHGVRNALFRRVMVFSSGIEVEEGQIEDTNTPMIAERLEQEGFSVTRGGTLKDDEILFAGILRGAIERGFRYIITTGGVGAEDKDCSVEAILRLDAEAATPYLVKFEVGHGRHKKPGIRIGVGQVGTTTLIALPGPNAEVEACLDILVKGMKSGVKKEALAAELAAELKSRLREKMHH
jgi:molybdenum cofactor synthesis domain-containing protein